ncbi:MAG TPA: hypothetical protein DCE41_14670 [Cytophagales bacterium]|nr:hypothetical protein [Cytophagales bacterium]HAA17865.1 hypothetical protein [Cytophagales bacterium]HAP58213.1 hypothetical protein [Cytophagales bacterium]
MKRIIRFHWLWFVVALLQMGFGLEERQGDILRFEISDGDTPIGEIQATRQVLGDHVVLHVVSTTKVKRLVTLTIEFEGMIEYKKGRMVRSEHVTQVNGYKHGETSSVWQGDHYRIYQDGEEKLLSSSVHYSGSLMYFLEPEYHGIVFSEKEGEFDPIVRVGEGQYIVEKSDGTRHTFTYHDGELQQIEYPHRMMDVVVRRK